ncbi:MAG TPA: glycine cleavage system protein H [Gammaproteobacteria bacterium]|nr:glycine cleavage system protein H [Gammaproteobacteria bacterium]
MECNGCEFHPELFYDDEFQIWVRREGDGSLTVGMTDISQTIAGKIIHVRVRRPGTRRPPGKPVATIESGKWAGPIPNFFDCVIEEGNPDVLDTPTLLNSDPYNAWVARVTPSAGPDEALAKFLTGDAAHEGYCERALREDIHCSRNIK